jgi:hypothetical protein
MPAVSKAQQRFMGMVHAAQKGDMENPSKEVEKAADSMTKKDAKDYASTSHKGLPNKKENMNTTITKERLKELVKEVMTEESEYQAFFQKALDKAGKGINDMNDDEKKAFFNKIDTAWNGKGEKNEGNAFGAAVSKAKEEGDDSFEVDGEKYKVESVSTELPTATIPSGIKMKLSQAIDKIKDAKLNPTQKLQLLAQIVDSLGMDKSQLGTITSKIKSKMESLKEGISIRDGKYRFYTEEPGMGYLEYDGKLISMGDFDHGAGCFWMTHKNFKGQKALDTPKDVIAFFKKNKIVK